MEFAMDNDRKNAGSDMLTSHTGHSLLNVFSTIIANVEMLQEDVDFSGRSGRRLERILKASRSGECIVRDIRNTVNHSAAAGTKQSAEVQLNGRVLVVDDEDEIVEIISRYLKKIGLDVVTETDCFMALERFSDTPDAFNLVISDFDMPHMTGLEFCQHIAALRSQVPQIMITGFDWEFLEEHIAKTGIAMILRKPLQREKVVDAVQRLLAC